MIKTDPYVLLLDRTVQAIQYLKTDCTSKSENDELIRKAIIDFTIECCRGCLKELAQYGTNTHGHAAVESLIIELRRSL